MNNKSNQNSIKNSILNLKFFKSKKKEKKEPKDKVNSNKTVVENRLNFDNDNFPYSVNPYANNKKAIEKSVDKNNKKDSNNDNFMNTINEINTYYQNKKNPFMDLNDEINIKHFNLDFKENSKTDNSYDLNNETKVTRAKSKSSITKNKKLIKNNSQIIEKSESSIYKYSLQDKDKSFIDIICTSNKSILLSIGKYLEYNEILALKNCSKITSNAINKNFITRYVTSGGISQKCRLKFWINNIYFKKLQKTVVNELKYIEKITEKEEISNDYNIDNLEKEFSTNLISTLNRTTTKYSNENVTDSLNNRANFELFKPTKEYEEIQEKYIKLYELIQIRSVPLKYKTEGVDKYNRPKKTPFSKSVDEISKDLNRTFHEGKFNSEETILSLERILVSISFIRPEIGYCQGMNFVSGALLELLNNEETAFWTFLYMIDEYELNSLYYENMPDFSIRVFQLEHYIKKYFQQLYIHFKKNQINAELIFSKWILTVFSLYLPFNSLSKVYDVFLIEGWKAVIIFCLIFLEELQPIFLSMDLQKISKYMRENNRNLHKNINDILDKYWKYSVSNSELFELREEYFREQVVNKIKDSKDNWDTDQLEAVEIYQQTLEKIQKNSKCEINFYKQKFEYFNMLFKAGKEEFKKIRQKYVNLKNELEALVESKASYEKILGFLQNNLDLNENNDKQPKGNSNIIINIKNNDDDASKVKKEIKTIDKKNKNCAKKIQTLNKELFEIVSRHIKVYLYYY